jgi:hypothetical protein
MVPLQLVAVAVAVNATGEPTIPDEGTEAVVVNEHLAVVVLMTIDPLFELTTPAIDAVIVQLKVPAAE